MSGDEDGCEWENVSSGTGHPGSPGPKAVKRLFLCMLLHVQPQYIYVCLRPITHAYWKL